MTGAEPSLLPIKRSPLAGRGRVVISGTILVRVALMWQALPDDIAKTEWES